MSNLHLIESLNDKDLSSSQFRIRKATVEYLKGVLQANHLMWFYNMDPQGVEDCLCKNQKRAGYESQRVINHFRDTGEILTREQVYGKENKS